MLARRISLASAFLLGACVWAQEPAVDGGANKPKGPAVNAAALAGSKQDPAAVERGATVFRNNCAGCHGSNAKGGPGAPNLLQSSVVLEDEKGILIGPVIREGRPDKGMPKLPLNETQIADVVAWLHVRAYEAGHRVTYTFGDVLTGNAQAGHAYFDAHCASCHSTTADLAGVGKRYDPLTLQGLWLHPGGGRQRGGGRGQAHNDPRTVTVTLASGKTYSGKLEQLDDFTVGLRDEHGEYHSFSRNGDEPKISVKDPLRAHTEMLHGYQDSDIHNVTAYLATLK